MPLAQNRNSLRLGNVLFYGTKLFFCKVYNNFRLTFCPSIFVSSSAYEFSSSDRTSGWPGGWSAHAARRAGAERPEAPPAIGARSTQIR